MNSVPEQATLSSENPAHNPIVSELTIDGGYSGEVTITRRRARDPRTNPDLVVVESDDLDKLVLTTEQAATLAATLREVVA